MFIILRIVDQDAIEIKWPDCKDNLRDYTHFKILSLEEIWHIGKCIIGGLRHLHEKLDIAHYSLRPRNVLRQNNVWKLAGVGLQTEDEDG